MPVAYIRDQNAAESSWEHPIPYAQHSGLRVHAHPYMPSLSLARRLATFPSPLLLRKDGINRRKEAKGALVTPASVEQGQNRWHNLASARTLSLGQHSHIHTKSNTVRENIQRRPLLACRIPQTSKPHEYKPSLILLIGSFIKSIDIQPFKIGFFCVWNVEDFCPGKDK